MIIRVACFSDTHTKHNRVELPECDIAIFAGDSTNRGEQYDTMNFMHWFNEQHQATHKIMIAGNHEVAWDPNYYNHGQVPEWASSEYLALTYPAVQILNNSSVNVWGLNIFGTPMTPDFFPEYWGFNRTRGEIIRAEWAKIPDNTDILISHGPMQGSLDWIAESGKYGLYPEGHVGCSDLRDKVMTLPQLKLFACGHIHGNTNVIDIHSGDRKFKYANVACLNNRYNFIHQPQLVEIDL